MDKFQSHFSGCSEFVNFIFRYGGNKFCSQFIYHKYTFLYAVIVVTYTIFFTYCKCDLHFLENQVPEYVLLSILL